MLLTRAPRITPKQGMLLTSAAPRYSTSAPTATSLEVIDDTCLLHLPDRTISYSLYTPPTPAATLFYLHGYPSSRLEAAALLPYARARSLQIISPDRPGFGQSTFHPYTIASYPSDLLAIADSLGVSGFSVLGASGGGPFALSSALPSNRVQKVGLLASAPPWDMGVNDMTLTRRFFALLAMTPVFNPLASAALAGARAALRAPAVQAWIDRLASQGLDDRALMRTLLEPFHQGTLPFTHETRLLTQRWDLDLGKITQKVVAWHAEGDGAAPISMMRPLVAKLPRGELRTFEGGHFDAGAHLTEILEYFAPR